MARTFFLALALTAVPFASTALFASTAQAQSAWGPACTDAEREAVGLHFQAFGRASRALGAATDEEAAALLETMRAEHQAMRADRCGHRLSDDAYPPPPLERRDELLSWLERGGMQFLEDSLRDDRSRFSLPPVVVPSLRPETMPETDPMLGLLCPDGPTSLACGMSGELFRARAQSWLEMHAREQALRQEARPASDGGGAAGPRCEAEARARPAAEQYGAYVICMTIASQRATLLPLGRFHAPDGGWLVVRGRRGHYQYCDEVHAFDLATGAHYETAHCSELFSLHGIETHDRARAGRVPVEVLRELALLLVITPHIQEDVRAEIVHGALPTGIVLGPRSFGGGGGGWGSSAQTQLAWAWSRGPTPRAQGTFTWPDSDDSRQAYADHLLRVLDASFVEGCAPAALPRDLEVGDLTAAVSPIDADPASRERTEDALGARLHHIRAPRCR